jgi:hypothetical protein
VEFSVALVVVVHVAVVVVGTLISAIIIFKSFSVGVLCDTKFITPARLTQPLTHYHPTHHHSQPSPAWAASC